MGILITSEPIIRYGETELTLPMPTKIYIDAIREVIQKDNFDRELEEKQYGFRLIAEYEWDSLTTTQMEPIIDFVNSTLKKYQKLGPRFFEAVITEFTKPNPVLQRDSCTLKLKGKKLMGNYPNPDQWFLGWIYFDMPVGILAA